VVEPRQGRRRRELLAALEEGVDSREYARWAKSRKSLHVRIFMLREAGHNIASIPLPAINRATRPPVLYKLIKN
jgi:hypothetical protein